MSRTQSPGFKYDARDNSRPRRGSLMEILSCMACGDRPTACEWCGSPQCRSCAYFQRCDHCQRLWSEERPTRALALGDRLSRYTRYKP